MTITPDTNVLARILVEDDPAQTLAAEQVLLSATLTVINLPTLCELSWVLRSVYKYSKADIAHALRRILSIQNVVFDELAVQAGLDILDAGGDFADGIVAYEGRCAGGKTFVSFNRRAVTLLKLQGHEAKLLSPTGLPPS